jgi:hypothetical protein
MTAEPQECCATCLHVVNPKDEWRKRGVVQCVIHKFSVRNPKRECDKWQQAGNLAERVAWLASSSKA